MLNNKKSRNSGGLVISEEVIASIAVNAAKDVEGVSGFVSHPKSIKNFYKISDGNEKYTDIVLSDTDIKIHIYLKVKGGTKIPALAENVQKNIKNAVQNMTGTMVSDVDVSICSVDFDNEPIQ